MFVIWLWSRMFGSRPARNHWRDRLDRVSRRELALGIAAPAVLLAALAAQLAGFLR